MKAVVVVALTGGGGVGFQNLLPRLEWLYLTLAGEGAEGERDS